MHKIVKEILEKRGFKSEQEIAEFLNPDYEKLSDPFLLPDMKRAVTRIAKAVKNDEKVVVYGDYDVDGMTASTLLVEALKKFGIKSITSYTPDRFSEGYGLNTDAIKKIAKEKTELIITVDCGSLSHQEIELAGKLGVDVVVTDHHGVAETKLPAVAVVNPHLPECKAEFRDYAGVGVAFQLVRALQTELTGLELGQEKWLLDLVSLGTVSDIVPLVGDNRVLVHWGLKVLAKTRRLGLKALVAVVRINQKQVSARDVGFALGPRLNASGRLETAELALRLLQTEDNAEALELATKLDKLNFERRKEQDAIFNEAVQGVDDSRPVLIVSGDGWNEGVIGIVASKLVERFGKPAFVLSVGEKQVKGSGRSFGDFKLNEVIDATRKFLVAGGGHSAAGGVTLARESLEKWCNAVQNFYKSLGLKKQADHLLPRVDIDRSGFQEIDVELVRELEALEPFGMDNERPVFNFTNVSATFVDRIGSKKNHLKLTVSDGKEKLKFLAFSPPEEWFIEPNTKINIWVNLEINEWQGSESVEGRIILLK